MVRFVTGEMLSVKEVAGLLSVSPKTVYALIRSGIIKSHRVGAGRGVIRVSSKQLDTYLQSSESAPAVVENHSKPRRRKRLREIDLEN
ncbi:MAG: helix-turn-helix domain-containing protein [Planctomycetota bacterium]